MKTLHQPTRLLCYGFLATLFFCCSSDEMFYSDEKNNLSASMKLSENLLNAENPYDKTGRAYRQIYQNYLSIYADSVFTTTEIIYKTGLIATQTADFMEIQEPYSPIEASIIENMLSDQYSTLEHIIRNSSLTPHNQENLIFLVEGIKNQPVSDIYESVIDFENMILLETDITENDRRVLLVISSIIRYSIIDNGDDTDWGNQNTGIIKAALYGVEENNCKAMLMAVVFKIVQS